MADYVVHVAGLSLGSQQRHARIKAAQMLSNRAGELALWMTRPTAVRLAELQRTKAWPFLSWLLVEQHVPADLELLLAKPAGCDLPKTWCDAHPDDLARATAAAANLGWSANWTRQVLRHALPLVCLAAGTPFTALTRTDLAAIDELIDAAAGPRERVRQRWPDARRDGPRGSHWTHDRWSRRDSSPGCGPRWRGCAKLA